MFVSDRPEIRILDLGCGDGLFVKDLLRSFNVSQVVMVDGSHEMLDAAMQQIKDHRCVKFVKASFQTLLQDDPFDYQFDFIFAACQFREKLGLRNTGGYANAQNLLLNRQEQAYLLKLHQKTTNAAKALCL